MQVTKIEIAELRIGRVTRGRAFATARVLLHLSGVNYKIQMPQCHIFIGPESFLSCQFDEDDGGLVYVLPVAVSLKPAKVCGDMFMYTRGPVEEVEAWQDACQRLYEMPGFTLHCVMAQ